MLTIPLSYYVIGTICAFGGLLFVTFFIKAEDPKIRRHARKHV